MAPNSSTKLTAFLALAAASPSVAFAPSLQHRQASVQLSARKQDDNAVVDGLKGAAAFMAGMGIMTQMAFADPGAIAPLDEGGCLSR